jgi:hypothetical protein
MNQDNSFKDGKFLTGKAKYVFSLILIAFVFIFIFTGGNPISAIGWKKVPGDLFEKRFYSGKYKVIISENQASSKLYKLTADLDRHIHCDPGDECGSLAYWVSTIYWPNGGYISFGDDSCAIGLEHETVCTATDGHKYSVLMTSTSA